MLQEIMKMTPYEVRNYMDNRNNDLCVEDVNALLTLMGVDEKLKVFIDSEIKGILKDAKRADRIALTYKDYASNIEFETNGATRFALYKQAKYAVNIAETLNLPVKSIMIIPQQEEIRYEILNIGVREHLKILVLPYYAIDGDEQLKIIKYKNKNNIKLNRYDIVFLNFAIYTKYSMEPHEMLLEVSKLLNEAKINENVRLQLKVLHELDCLKRIDEQYQDMIIEVIEMECSYVNKYGERKIKEGKKEGKKEGIKETARRMLEKGYAIEEIASITLLTPKEILKL